MTSRVYLGGTFDPIHLAHVRLAQSAAQATHAQEVSFVVSAQPPHKKDLSKKQNATPQQRLAMVQLVVDELNANSQSTQYVCEDCEFKREGLSYTIDTVAYLRDKYPEDKLYWVIGMDSYNSLETWHEWQSLTDYITLVVADRPGWPGEEVRQNKQMDGVIFIDMPPMAVSSTDIRKTLTNGKVSKDIDALLHTYIQTNGLYSSMTKLNEAVNKALEDLKAQQIVHLEVAELTDVADHLIIANGTSGRHVKSIAKNIVEELKPKGFKPIGVEGLEEGEWVLVDYGDTVVHVMQPQTRDFYELEKLWSKIPAHREQAQQDK